MQGMPWEKCNAGQGAEGRNTSWYRTPPSGLLKHGPECWPGTGQRDSKAHPGTSGTSLNHASGTLFLEATGTMTFLTPSCFLWNIERWRQAHKVHVHIHRQYPEEFLLWCLPEHLTHCKKAWIRTVGVIEIRVYPVCVTSSYSTSGPSRWIMLNAVTLRWVKWKWRITRRLLKRRNHQL